MAKSVALWLIENTKLTFRQISDFCGMHELQIEALANGEGNVAAVDPVMLGQLEKEEILRCETDQNASLIVNSKNFLVRKKAKTYVSLAKRKEIRNGVLWIVRSCPDLKDADIIKFIPTTKNTVCSIRLGTYWDMKSLVAKNPVFIGLCTQEDLDQLVALNEKRKYFFSKS
ncbi:cell cycle transcriptional regulator TrcR [Holospora obtusa]|nr:cell cycle transcriptional regulator TrcR [Holospora obtusa]